MTRPARAARARVPVPRPVARLDVVLPRRSRRPRRGPRTGAPWVVLALVVSVFGALVLRLGQLQLVDPANRAALVRTAQTRVITEPAVRGRILDRTGAVLADNAFSTDVTIERRVLVEAADGGRALVQRVAGALSLPFDQLWGRTQLCGTPGAPAAPACFNGSPYIPVPVATDVDPQRALSLLERPESFPGVGVRSAASRTYPGPSGANLAHLLGYTARSTAAEVQAGTAADEDSVGRAGLERQYDAQLRGSNGSRTVRIDARGIVTGELSAVRQRPGADIVTHLDAVVQARVERILADTVATARRSALPADSAAAVVMDVRTGAVVAAASLPTYDPQLFAGGVSSSDYERLSGAASGYALRSRVWGETYPPASTFKVVSVAAAARAGYSLDARYDCSPSLTVGGRVFRNYESRGYGPIDLNRALVVSCDTVFYRFADAVWRSLGGLAALPSVADPFITAARTFGIGQRTGIDLPGESPGVLPDRQWKLDTWNATRADTCRRAQTGYPEVADPAQAAYLKQVAVENCASGYEYRPGDAINLSIGQGDVRSTVLQLAVAYAAIANGGTVVTPRVAAATRAHGGAEVALPAPATRRLDVPPAVLAYERAALAGVTQPGGSAGSAFRGYPSGADAAAGKTGTGEVFGRTAVAWFAGYAPVSAPRYVVVAMVSQGGSGSAVAAPAVRAILDAVRARGLM